MMESGFYGTRLMSPWLGRIHSLMRQLNITETSEDISPYTDGEPVETLTDIAQWKLLQRLYDVQIKRREKEVGYVNKWEKKK